jgi:hypothetical protein
MKTLDDILQFFHESEVEMKRKTLIYLIKAFNSTELLLVKLSQSAKEYIVNNLFTEKECKRFYHGQRNSYFIETLKRRIDDVK